MAFLATFSITFNLKEKELQKVVNLPLGHEMMPKEGEIVFCDPDYWLYDDRIVYTGTISVHDV